MGQVTFGASFQAESARAGIDETIAMGRVVYSSDVPIVLLDETWILAKEPMTTYTIMSIGEIDIYLGFDDPDQPTPEVMPMAEEKSGSTLSVEAEEFQISEKIKPTQPTPVVEEEVEEESRSDLSSEIRYTDVEYIRYGSSSANVEA